MTDEKEVLFKAGTIFKCTGVKRDDKKRLFVTLEELDPNKLSETDKKSLMASEKARFESILSKNFEGSLEKYQTAAKLWNDAWPKWREQGLDKQRYAVEEESYGD